MINDIREYRYNAVFPYFSGIADCCLSEKYPLTVNILHFDKVIIMLQMCVIYPSYSVCNYIISLRRPGKYY